MGYCHDTDKYKLLIFEERKESVILTSKEKGQIFEKGYTEITKKLLKELVDFVNKNPRVLKQWGAK